MQENTLTRLEGLLARFANGEEAAANELAEAASGRLHALTRAMMRDFERLRRYEDSLDVLQAAQVRLAAALRATRTTSGRDYLRLAAVQIRRQLVDLSRHYHGKEGEGANRDSVGGEVPQVAGREPTPSHAAELAEVQEKVERLPDELREVVDLLYYHGHTQAEAAEVLGVAAITVKRRWAEARMRLGRLLAPQEAP